MLYFYSNDQPITANPFNDSNVNSTQELHFFHSVNHFLLVQGQSNQYLKWSSIKNNTIFLIFASYDNSIFHANCNLTHYAKCIYIPETTWTQGRNFLILEALKLETIYKYNVPFWTFADADANPECKLPLKNYFDTCTLSYLDFILNISLPVISLFPDSYPMINTLHPESKIMIKIQAFDACWNTFHRSVLNLIMPYHTDQDSHSWWSSQASLWYSIQCLEPWYSASPIHIFYNNPLHSGYPKGSRILEEEKRAAYKKLGHIHNLKLKDPPPDYENEWNAENVIDFVKDDNILTKIKNIQSNYITKTCLDTFKNYNLSNEIISENFKLH